MPSARQRRPPPLKGVMGVLEEEWASSRIVGDPHSSIVDLPLTAVQEGRCCRWRPGTTTRWGYADAAWPRPRPGSRSRPQPRHEESQGKGAQPMSLHPLAGKPAPYELLVNVPRLVSAYYTAEPDLSDPAQRVAFGTSGHRGSSFKGNFNEDHILAICQAICEYRQAQGITGPLFIGMDTHALSEPALASAIEVFAGQRAGDHGPGRPGLHADAGHLPRDPHLQPWPDQRAGRRRGHHALAQSARGRRLQVQPAQRRPADTDDHQGHPGARQRDPAGRAAGGQAHAPGPRHQGRDHAPARLHHPLRVRPGQRHRHARHRRVRPQDRRRSDGRRQRAVTGSRSPRCTG